jgi:hypothetical protein
MSRLPPFGPSRWGSADRQLIPIVAIASSRHASAQAAASRPRPDASLPVHAAQISIDSTSILRNMTSGSGISACATLSTPQ